MVVCVVPGCGSDSKKTSKYSFHRLPQSVVSRARWFIALGPMSTMSHVCSRHFEANMIIKHGSKIKMKPGAVPTLFMDSSPTEESSHLTECPEEDDEIEMMESSNELMACRACLAVDGRMYSISGSGLEDALATFAGIVMPEAACFPRHLCAFCVTKLSKCVAFRDRCQRSTALLESLLEKGPLKMNDITAIDRDAHQLSNNLNWNKVFQFGSNPLLEVMPLIKTETENNKNSDEETECIEAEYLDSYVSENNDSNVQSKSTLELPKEKQKKCKSENIQLKKWKRNEVKKDKTEYDDLQLETDDDIDINCETDASDVDTETSEETLCIQKKLELLKKMCAETKIATKKKKRYEVPPSIDIKAFEEKYNVEYKFLNEEEQKQEIEDRKANNVLRYCCDMCGTGYKKKQPMVNHLWVHDPRLGPFECAVCRKRYRSSHDLLRHRYTHRDRYTCRECGLVTRNSSRAITHYKVHQGSSHACPYCNAVYARKTSYFNHIRTTHPERNEACDECGETFLSTLGVRQHKALAHRLCNKTFANAASFSLHEARKHRGVRAAAAPFRRIDQRGRRRTRGTGPLQTCTGPQQTCTGPREALSFVCEICGRVLTTALSLTNHRNVHFGIKPYSCPVCDKKFTYKISLQNHAVVHTGKRPYRCEHCRQMFSQKTNLQRHIKSVHFRMRARCKICGKSMLAGSLYEHVRSMHMNAGQPRPKRDRKNEKKRKPVQFDHS